MSTTVQTGVKQLLRKPEELMIPEHAGALKPSRLSFSRTLITRMVRHGWSIDRRKFDLDANGRGEVIYRIQAPNRVFDFIVFSFCPEKAELTDRIIGRQWDMMAALIDGEASEAQIAQTRIELPKLYAGRATANTLVWARSNRSARVFPYVVDCLAAGRQPELAPLAEVGYLMRNTGLDANGTFGTRSFLAYERDHPLKTPYHPQFLSAYMMREFGYDLADHLAKARAADAVRLHPAIKRYLGVGNSSGLGLVLFVNNHPRLINRWIELRESAITRAKRVQESQGSPALTRLLQLIDRYIVYKLQDRVHYQYFTASATIADDLARIRQYVQEFAERGTIAGSSTEYPWETLCSLLSTTVDRESLEVLHSLLVELYPAIADELDPGHIDTEVSDVAPAMRVSEIRSIIRRDYQWVFQFDMSRPSARHYFWYKSAEAEEPRRGVCGGEVTGVDLAVDVAGDIQRLDADLAGVPEDCTVAWFLARHPEHRAAVQRMQSLRECMYHSPHMNVLAENFIPAHLIRMIIGPIYGLEKLKDVSERWVRGIIFHGAPIGEDLPDAATEDWIYPPEPVL